MIPLRFAQRHPNRILTSQNSFPRCALKLAINPQTPANFKRSSDFKSNAFIYTKDKFYDKEEFRQDGLFLDLKLSPEMYGTGEDGIAQVFDSEDIWKSRIEKFDLSGIQETPGLLGRPELQSPEGFSAWTENTIHQSKHLVSKITNVNSELDALMIVKRLDRLSDLLCSLIDVAEFVRSNHPISKFSNKANSAYLKMVSFMNKLNTDPALYKALSKVLSNPDVVQKFSKEEVEVANIFLRDFEKSGIHLDSKKRQRFVQLNDDINELGREFLGNPMCKETILSFQRSEVKGCEGWWGGNKQINHIPTSPGYASMFLRTSQSSEARKKMYLASNTPGQSQLEVLEGLLSKRADLAELLGHRSFGDFFLADKMARSPESVQIFLDALTKQHQPAVHAELEVLRGLQKADPFAQGTRIEAWDQPYYTQQYEQLAKKKSSFDSLSAYFSVGTVLQGLSNLLRQLYGIWFRPVARVSRSELWDPAVRKIEVVDEDTNRVVGIIYFDLYSRSGKPATAAHYTVQCSRRLDFDLPEDTSNLLNPNSGKTSSVGVPLAGTKCSDGNKTFQIPVVVLSCGFSNPTRTVPSLLELSEVETLFHEMGHAIHSMLARTEFHNVAGTRCKIDFVEFPSIFLESFALSPEVVAEYARHFKTGEKIPFHLLNEALSTGRTLKSLDTQHQIMLSMVDQKYHSLRPKHCRPNGFSTDLLPEICTKYAPVSSHPQPPFGFKFGHLYAYSASYYTYLLGRTLSGRLWKAGFDSSANGEPKVPRRKAGNIIHQEVLRWGGGRDPWYCIASALDGLYSLNGAAIGSSNLEDLSNLTHSDASQAMKIVGKWGLPA